MNCMLQMQSHLKDMYTHPATAEQCLHNALKVVNAMRSVGVDYDIQVSYLNIISISHFDK